AGPFLVLEYVSPSSTRKDYEDNFRKYEQELRVPVYLVFYPERQDLRVYRLDHDGYQLVAPGASGRIRIDELDLEVAIKERWVRFWHQGELLPLPDELQRALDRERQRADQE